MTSTGSISAGWTKATSAGKTVPQDAIALEREEYGNFFGFLHSLELGDLLPAQGTGQDLASLETALQIIELRKRDLQQLSEELSDISYQLEDIRRSLIKAEYAGISSNTPEMQKLQREQAVLQEDFSSHLNNQVELERQLSVYKATFSDASGQEMQIELANIVRVYQPNRMSVLAKTGFYISKLYELIVQ